jgi:hypothetical protein
MGVILTNNNQGGSIKVLRTPGLSEGYTRIGNYVLDAFPGAVAAYSLRKLRYNYKGPVIRVRRSSDNAELNIGFDGDGIGSRLDERALLAFVGNANGFVTMWYDQSGNGMDQTRVTANKQPQIVTNGTIYTDNGKHAIYFDGTKSFRSINTISLTSPSGEWSSFGVFNSQSFDIARVFLSSDGTSAGPQNERIGQFMRTAANQRFQAIAFRISTPPTPVAVTDDGPICLLKQTIVHSIRTSNTVEIFANGETNGPSTILGTPTTMSRPLDIGYRDGVSFSIFQPFGYIQELIHYPLNSTSFHQRMVDAMNLYYKAY